MLEGHQALQKYESVLFHIHRTSHRHNALPYDHCLIDFEFGDDRLLEGTAVSESSIQTL
jgi:hypothetical protein